MGGKFSRDKGRRNEQNLVIYLSNRGYQAERILRQYQAAGQPDVRALKDGKEYTFEAKARSNTFKSIYDLYYSERDINGIVSFVLTSGGKAVAMSTDLEKLTGRDMVFRNLTLFPPALRKQARVYERIVRLDKLRQSADYLVIKDNGKPNIFLRFWV